MFVPSEMDNDNSCYWPILLLLDEKWLTQTQSFVIAGETGESVLLILNDGKVYGFNDNKNCLLGLENGETTVNQPQEIVELSNIDGIKDIVNGWKHVLLLTTGGDIYFWGQIGDGTCDNGNVEKTTQPTLVESPEKFVSIKSGFEYCLALSTTGALYSWGCNCHGQIDCDKETIQLTPAKVAALESKSIITIESGGWHWLALTDQGEVFSRGLNSDGQLGSGNTEELESPVKMYVSGVSFKGIAAGSKHSLLLTTNGQIYAAGENESGQLGYRADANNSSNTRLVKISSPFCFRSVIAYSDLSAALSECGSWYVWGFLNQNIYSFEPHRTKFFTVELAFSYHLSPQVTPSLTLFRPKQTNIVINRLSNKFNKEEGSDLVFSIGGEKIYAHRGYLQMTSSYLNRMLAECWQKDSVVDINEFEYPVFFAYLQFLYTGSLEINPEHAYQLLSLAHLYLETEIQERSITILRANISVANCCQLYQQTLLYELKSFHDFIIEFIKKNLFLVFTSDEYAQMKPVYCQSLSISVGQFALSMNKTEDKLIFFG